MKIFNFRIKWDLLIELSQEPQSLRNWLGTIQAGMASGGFGNSGKNSNKISFFPGMLSEKNPTQLGWEKKNQE